MRRKDGVGVWDLPLWRDWLAWFTVGGVALFAQPSGHLVDYTIHVVIAVWLFGLMPGAFRRGWREGVRDEAH